MADPEANGLRGKTLLVVEDEYMVATDLAALLEDLGAEVVGPAPSVAKALELVEREGSRLDGALLDINLGGHRVYPVADRLAALGVPFIFTTGYSGSAIPEVYAGVPRCEKPIDKQRVKRMLAETL